MAVYRPTYTDQKTGKTKESRVWWYDFTYAGRRVKESSKSTRKTIAVEAEKKRKLELERAFNGVEDRRKERIRPVSEVAADYLEQYKLRHRAPKFASYAVGHIGRHLGSVMVVDVNDKTVKDYQSARLKEKAAPKSINEEVGFLLRILEEQGDLIRAKMRRLKTLKLSVRKGTARAYSLEEKAALIAEAGKRRSPAIVPALMLALHAGLRDAEIRGLQWARIDLVGARLFVGTSKTEGGEGRGVPLNSDLLAALVAHAKWYLGKFGETRPEWYVFPFGKTQPTDPTRPATSFKTVWGKVKADAGVKGRWHDSRHTFITDLAESGEAADETIRDMAGHVSNQMLKHYSHIRMQAKRRAVESLVTKAPAKAVTATDSVEAPQESTQVDRPN